MCGLLGMIGRVQESYGRRMYLCVEVQARGSVSVVVYSSGYKFAGETGRRLIKAVVSVYLRCGMLYYAGRLCCLRQVSWLSRIRLI